MSRIPTSCILVCVLIVLMSMATHALGAAVCVKAGLYQNPPLSYVNKNGGAAGVLVDVLEYVAKKEGWQIEYVTGTLDEGLNRLKNGEIDLLITVAYSEERAKLFDFNKVTAVVNWGEIYTTKNSSIHSYLDLDGKRLAVLKNHIHFGILREMLTQFGVHPDYVVVDSFDDVFRLLDQQRVDAGMVSRFFGMQNDDKYHVKSTTLMFSPVEIRYAAPKGKNADMLTAIDTHLEKLRADKGSIYYKALDNELGVVSKSGMPAWLKMGLSALAIAVVVFSSMAFVLKRKVKARTLSLERMIVARQSVEQALLENERKYRELVENANSIILKMDTNGNITFFNEYAEKFFGFSKEEIIGRSVIGTIVPSTDTSGRDMATMLDELTTNPARFSTNENENIKKNGEKVWVSWANRPLYAPDGSLDGILSVGHDVSERIQYERQLLFQANYDQLTGLPNRNLLNERFKQAIAYQERHGDFLALMLLDLDNFKVVNDTLGHHAGDELLQMVAVRLQSTLRQTDTVARIGGDEFIIIPSALENTDELAHLAEKIISFFKFPFEIGDHEIFVTTSIGIVTCPEDGKTVDVLMANADAAMYHAKKEGKNNFQFFTAEINQRVRLRLDLETKIRWALDRDEFTLNYQPQVDAGSGRVTGVEVLLRWNPEGGAPVSPVDFIPLLEETGLIVPVGEWVLRTACRQVKEWTDVGHLPMQVSINISGRQFSRGDLPATVAKVIAETGIDPACLCLELTESIAMDASDENLRIMNELKDMGLTLSIDDFGTGYSSLSYLKRLPIHELKIDRSFITELPTSANDAAIVNTIINLARSLGLQVVAEGVETIEQLQFLAGHSCETIQGFYFSKPLCKEELEKYLVSGRPLDEVLESVPAVGTASSTMG